MSKQPVAGKSSEEEWKANRKLTQLGGLAEEWKYLGRVTGMSPYSTPESVTAIGKTDKERLPQGTKGMIVFKWSSRDETADKANMIDSVNLKFAS